MRHDFTAVSQVEHALQLLPWGGTTSVPQTGRPGDDISQSGSRQSGHSQSHPANRLMLTGRRKCGEPPLCAPGDVQPRICDRGTYGLQRGRGTGLEQRSCEHERSPISFATSAHTAHRVLRPVLSSCDAARDVHGSCGWMDGRLITGARGVPAAVSCSTNLRAQRLHRSPVTCR